MSSSAYSEQRASRKRPAPAAEGGDDDVSEPAAATTSCSQCAATFGSQREWRRHFVRVHVHGRQALQCAGCEFETDERDKLQLHMELAHGRASKQRAESLQRLHGRPPKATIAHDRDRVLAAAMQHLSGVCVQCKLSGCKAATVRTVVDEWAHSSAARLLQAGAEPPSASSIAASAHTAAPYYIKRFVCLRCDNTYLGGAAMEMSADATLCHSATEGQRGQTAAERDGEEEEEEDAQVVDEPEPIAAGAPPPPSPVAKSAPGAGGKPKPARTVVVHAAKPPS